MVIIEDNWTLISNVLHKYEWVDTATIRKETGILSSIIIRLLQTASRREEVRKEFRHFNTSEDRGKMWGVGSAKRYKYFWSLVK